MIKNIIFDVGNVLVKWDPINIIKQAFPECPDPNQYLALFKDIIMPLDAGKIDFATANKTLQTTMNTSKEKIDNLFAIFLASLAPMPDSLMLLDNLISKTEYSVYCLTNMSKECYAYLNQKYDFLRKFKGIVVSADIKLIKPDPQIYIYTLNKFNLVPEETIFIDDMLENITAARNMKIHGIHFTNLATCKDELKALGLFNI